ncbi:hypothetical protein, conserved [Plasmodium gonderi]|uniref:Abscisic acid G-protein coupled receptor-like domain-containing protein n=1 Tax=Plasmodium gonderi TaxID=77519 RepID=A0A1Y1JKF5_PLAGO|nr:hypothetical protein, conserved [Plasmodium gonderi]GAW83016.1 hypothetical protein, conserved [Plasmodium gonderi]
MISITAIFLCMYHVVLSVLGCVFFENYLFKDFDNSFSIVKIIFSCSFVLCLSLLSMIVFEILGFITTTLKLFIWYIDIAFLVLFIYLIIPISLIYTYVTYDDENTGNRLFKFKYFYTTLAKMRNKKKKFLSNDNDNDDDKTNFMKKLLYVSEDLIVQMKNYNRKIRNKNKQKICKFLIGCFLILPLLWFTFYKISMITLKNNNDIYDKTSDIYDIGNVLQEKFKIINKEFSEEYDTNNEKNKFFFFFFKLMKNLFIYISVTGMTLVSALSAFTSLYSPYTNISIFFFFVTIKKVKIIENKIKFVTNELSLKKKLLVLYDHPNLFDNYCAKNKNDISILQESLSHRQIHTSTYDKNMPNKKYTSSSFYMHSLHRDNNNSINDSRNTINNEIETLHAHIDYNHTQVDTVKRYSHNFPTRSCDCVMGETLNKGIIPGREKNRNTISSKKQEDVEYICSKPFKKCNLYQGSHKSIYKDIYETFMKKENDLQAILNERVDELEMQSGINELEMQVEEKTHHDLGKFYETHISGEHHYMGEMEITQKPQSKLLNNARGGKATTERSHVDANDTTYWVYNSREIGSNSNFTSPSFYEKIGSNNNYSLYKRSTKSGISTEDRKHVYYKGRFIFFKTAQEEEGQLHSLHSQEGYDVGNSQMANVHALEDEVEEEEEEKTKKKMDLPLFSKLKNFYSVKKFFQNCETLPHNIIHKRDACASGNVYSRRNKESMDCSSNVGRNLHKRYISNFLFNSFEKSYKTFKSVKDFFTRNKRNIKKKKKKKEILIQDIKSLEYMAKNLYFLLDEVIKEQIRINHSSSFNGMLLYLLGILMSILCVYKIIKTCYIIYMVEIYYRFISTCSSGHVLMLFYSKNMNIDFINDIKNVLHIVHININLENYVISITSILLLCFIFTNLKSFMERIIKLRYSAKSSLYSNLAILLMCEIMDLYFSAYCIQLFDYLPLKEKIKMLYIFFNNNLLNLLKLKYHFDFVYVISLVISLFLIRLHHLHRSNQFREI